MLAVLGILGCIIAGSMAMKNGVITADTYYKVLAMFVTGLLIRGDKEQKGGKKDG